VCALPQVDERITCTSCRFRYASVRGYCPACGEAAPTRPEIVVAPATKAKYSPGRTTRSLFLLAICLLVASGLFLARVNGTRSTPSTIPAPAKQDFPPPTNVSDTTPSSDLAEEAPSKLSTSVAVAASRTPALQPKEGPAELWKEVKQGNVGAEVNLAKFYLGENSGAQNCEQARLLLTAAAKSRSKEADDVLSGEYAQRCR